MKRKWWTVCFLSILAGSALHFLYDLWPNPLTAVFAPVNESVWEHLKLLFWPFLAAGFALTRGQAEKPAAWSGFLLAELGMPVFLIGIYYTLHAGFGVQSVYADIGLYYLTLGLGFAAALRVNRSGTLRRGADPVYACAAGASDLHGGFVTFCDFCA